MKTISQSTSIKIPAKPEYIGVARLITAAFAGFLGLDSETVEDVKVAVSEACTSAILQLYKEAKPEDRFVEIISYARDNSLIIDIKYSTKDSALIGEAHFQTYDKDLGMSILTSIMDKVEVIKAKDQRIVLRLSKNIPE